MENSLVESTAPVYTLSTTSTLSGIPVHSIRQYIDNIFTTPFLLLLMLESAQGQVKSPR